MELATGQLKWFLNRTNNFCARCIHRPISLVVLINIIVRAVRMSAEVSSSSSSVSTFSVRQVRQLEFYSLLTFQQLIMRGLVFFWSNFINISESRLFGTVQRQIISSRVDSFRKKIMVQVEGTDMRLADLVVLWWRPQPLKGLYYFVNQIPIVIVTHNYSELLYVGALWQLPQ